MTKEKDSAVLSFEHKTKTSTLILAASLMKSVLRSPINTSETHARDHDHEDNRNHTLWSYLEFEGKGESDMMALFSLTAEQYKAAGETLIFEGRSLCVIAEFEEVVCRYRQGLSTELVLQQALDIFNACNF